MADLDLDLQHEYDTLQRALDRFQEQWEQHRTVDAFFAFSDALDHAVEVVARFDHQKTEREHEFRYYLMRLTVLLTGARLARQSAYEDTLVAIGKRMGDEASSDAGEETSFPAGTIVSCSTCGEGLYKIRTRATVADLVFDDGTLLTPLNQTIPARDVWKALACPHCGGRCYKDGQLHTLQYGWR